MIYETYKIKLDYSKIDAPFTGFEPTLKLI